AITAPGGYLLCDGTLYSRSVYSALFSILGTTYGQSGDDPSMFRVPDLRGRFILGVSSTHAMASTGGEETHVLTTAELAGHIHGLSGHTHAGAFHQHTMGNHTHLGVNHLHDLQNHSHAGANHQHDLQNHTHGYTYVGTGGGIASGGNPYGNIPG